jgi:hypothetical protein
VNAPTRTAPLTFGQQGYYLYDQVRDEVARGVLTMGGEWTLPAGVTAADVRSALGLLACRHESLRTTYVQRPQSMPVQVVSSTHRQNVAEFDSDEDEPPDAGLWARDFDLAQEPPFRFAVVGSPGNRSATLMCASHHIAVDGWGIATLVRDLFALLVGGKRTFEGTPPRGTVALANEEQGAGMRSKSAKSLQYWGDVTGRMPCLLYDSADVGAGHSQVILNSPAAGAALARLRHRVRLTGSALVLAAYGMALRSHHGLDQFVVLSPCSNRFDERDKDLVGCLQQLSAIAMDLSGGPSFTELARRTTSATMAAISNARYDCYEWCEVLASRGYESPYYVRDWIAYNFHSHLFWATGAATATSGSLPRWEFSASEVEQLPAVSLSVAPRGSALRIAATANTSVMSHDDLTVLLTEIEHHLVVAAGQVLLPFPT